MELSRQAQNCEIRVARTSEEKAAVYRLRYEVYVEERGIRSQYADHEQRWIKDPLDENGLLLMALTSAGVVGTVRLNCGCDGPLEFEQEYLMDRFRPYYPDRVSTATKFIVAPSYRKSLIAARLACEVFSVAKDKGIVFDFINVDDELVGFYQKMGYQLYGPKFCHAEFGRVPAMILLLDHVEYFRCIRSPFHRIAAKYPRDGESLDFIRQLVGKTGSMMTYTTAPVSGIGLELGSPDSPPPRRVGLSLFLPALKSSAGVHTRNVRNIRSISRHSRLSAFPSARLGPGWHFPLPGWRSVAAGSRVRGKANPCAHCWCISFLRQRGMAARLLLARLDWDDSLWN